MTSRAEGFLDRSGEGLGGGEGSTNFGRLTGFFKLCLRSSLPRAVSEADLDLSRLPLAGVEVNLDGRDECCGVPGGFEPGVGGGDSNRAGRA